MQINFILQTFLYLRLFIHTLIKRSQTKPWMFGELTLSIQISDWIKY